jgi:hypothetical protein
MKNIRSFIAAFLFLPALITGCHSHEEGGEKIVSERVTVTVESIHTANLAESIDLNATSAFLTKSMIKSPVAGYIEEIFVSPGENVSRNQVIYKIRTRESSVLKGDSLNPYSISGLITLKATISGMVLTVDRPRGDYIQEGEQLATIAVPSSFVFILDAPYESSLFIKPSSFCDVILQDGRDLKGTVYSRLPSVTPGSQTQRFILHVAGGQNLPENLIAKIRIVKRVIPDAALLSKSCILSDEVMQHFWVMKLVNDSVAVKVPVTTGIVNGDEVEIVNPAFSAADRFLASGNYGLGDTAKVMVVRNLKK